MRCVSCDLVLVVRGSSILDRSIININSETMENVMDTFSAHNVEILSPAFTVFRSDPE